MPSYRSGAVAGADVLPSVRGDWEGRKKEAKRDNVPLCGELGERGEAVPEVDGRLRKEKEAEAAGLEAVVPVVGRRKEEEEEVGGRDGRCLRGLLCLMGVSSMLPSSLVYSSLSLTSIAPAMSVEAVEKRKDMADGRGRGDG